MSGRASETQAGLGHGGDLPTTSSSSAPAEIARGDPKHGPAPEPTDAWLGAELSCVGGEL